MIKVERFKIAGLFALDLATLTSKQYGRERRGWAVGISAVWFRRKDGITRACIGGVSDYQHVEPTDVHEVIERMRDGRYGGSCIGRWDGTRYWGSQEPEVMAEHLELLRPMLEAYPAIPPGYDGWWRYPTNAELRVRRD